MPYLGGFEQWPEYKVHAKGACSSCQGLLAYSLERLKSLGEYDKNAGMSIVLGRTAELPKGVNPKELILMGDCVKKFRDKGIFVGGCPPLEMEPAWTIMDRVWHGPPDEWTRDYLEEIALFEEDVKKNRSKTGAKKK